MASLSFSATKLGMITVTFSSNTRDLATAPVGPCEGGVSSVYFRPSEEGMACVAI